MKRRIIVFFLTIIASFFLLGEISGVQAEGDIVASGSGSACGDWTLYTDGTLYIEGSSIGDFTSSNPPWYSYKEQVTSLIVSDNMRSIGIDAFYEMPNLKSVMVEGVTSFGKNSFGYCEALEEVHFVPSSYGSGSVSIGNSAFAGCTSLKEISFPSSTSINEYAFSGCSALKKIYLLPTAATISSFGAKTNSFSDVEATIYYPKNVSFFASVQSGEYGGTFTWEESIAGVYGTGCEWEYNENTSTLTITGTGEMAATMSGSQTPWYYMVDEIKHIVVNGEITSIPSYVFEYQTNVETIQLPKTVETLACNAFNDCEKLNNLLIPYSVNKFTMQFNRCGSMTDLYYEGTEEEWATITGVSNASGTSSGTKFNIHYLELHEKVESTCTEEGVEAYYSFGEDSIYTQLYDTDKQIIESPQVIEATGHSYGEWIIDTEATCTTEGSKHKECANCGSVEKRIIEALGHQKVIDESVAATCTTSGLTEGSHCDRCKEVFVEQEEVTALDHNFVEYVSDENATCTEDGTKTARCERCDATDTMEDEGSASGHEYIEYKSDNNATCIEDGTKTAKCIRCDEKDIIADEGSRLGHQEVIDEAVTPTCETVGKTEGSHCDRCKEVFVEQEEVAALGHNFEEYLSDENATCTEDGTKTAKCDRCDVTDTVADEGSVTGHEFEVCVGTDPTCTEEGYVEYACIKCWDTSVTYREKIEALGHEYIEYKSDNNATCIEDGTKTAKCTRCDETDTVADEGSRLGHQEVIDAAVEPTCETAGKTAGSHCDRCKEVFVEQEAVAPLGHNFVKYVSDESATCTEDGTKTAKCERCDATDTIADEGSATGHEFEACAGTDPTCNEEGYVEYACIKCWDTSVTYREKIDALGHQEVTDEAIAATCTASGLTEGSHCDRCEEVLMEQEVVKATGHSYRTSVILATTELDGSLQVRCLKCNDVESEEVIPAIGEVSLYKTKFVYNAKTQQVIVVATDIDGNVISPEYYTATNTSKKNVGVYTVTVTFKGNYEGTVKLKYSIVPKKPSSLTASLYQYGNKVKLTWAKSTGATGYRISYKKPGSSSYTYLTSTTKLTYTKSGLLQNKKYTFKVTPYYKPSGSSTQYYSTASTAYRTKAITTTTKGKQLVKVAKPTVAKSGTKVKVTWKNVANETGYQISRSTSSTGTNIVSTYKTTTGKSKTIAATKGTKYYYKVRAYRIANGRYIYGDWSAVRAYTRK